MSRHLALRIIGPTAWVPVTITLLLVSNSRADIFRWDNDALIPGTEGITPAPGVQFNDKSLQFADLAKKNLTNASFARSDLTSATFQMSTLTGAIFTDAEIQSANLSDTTSTGFTKEQLYTTASYMAGDLTGLRLRYNNLAEWDFSGQNLEATWFLESDLSGADFSDARISNSFLQEAILQNAIFSGADINMSSFFKTTQHGFTKEQLYSTASYQRKDLQRIDLGANDLSGWDFRDQNLASSSLAFANLETAELTGAELTDVSISGASLAGATSHGLTKEQFYTTRSYQSRSLEVIGLANNDLSGWDFDRQLLRRAVFRNSNLTDARFTQANISFGDLSRTELGGADFSDAIASNTNLTLADAAGASFANADLSFADTRGTTGLETADVKNLTNTILPDGRINDLSLLGQQTLVAYSEVPIPVILPGTMTIAPTAKLDLTDNAAIAESASANEVRSLLITGRGGQGLGGEWNGNGITSSTAAELNQTASDSRSIGYANNGSLPLGEYSEFHGVAVDSDSVLIAYTRTGDANLDGVVDDQDVTIVSATYAPGVPQPSWALGDFDFNGFVDDADVMLLGAFYDPSAPPLVAPPAANAAGVAAVPEPSALALVSVAVFLIALMARLRGRKKTTVWS